MTFLLPKGLKSEFIIIKSSYDILSPPAPLTHAVFEWSLRTNMKKRFDEISFSNPKLFFMMDGGDWQDVTSLPFLLVFDFFIFFIAF